MRSSTPMLEKETNGKPLVTVITVTYNSAAYVRDAVESVLAQSYENIEYIIGDDHSTDDTWQIIQAYEDPRIVAYQNEKNLGEYVNRNKAIDLASGKYLLFIDGDDYIYPHGIEYFTNQIEKFPTAAFAVQKGYTANVVYPVLLKPSEVLKNFYFSKSNLLTSSFASNFFNAGILKSIGGLSKQYVTADEEVRLRLAAQFPVLFIQGWVSWPRETPGQASSRIYDGTGMIELVRMSRELFAKGLIQDQAFEVQVMNSLKKSTVRVIKNSIRRGKYKQATKVLRETGYGLLELFRSLFIKNEHVDPVSGYTAGNPLKLKLNERVREKIL